MKQFWHQNQMSPKHKIQNGWQRYWLFLLLLIAMGLSLIGCGRPSDIFDPIIIGEATAAPTVLDTPNATPTRLPVTETPAVPTASPTTGAQTATARATVAGAQLTMTPIATQTPRRTGTRIARTSIQGTGTPDGQRGEAIVVTTPMPTIAAVTTTPTVIFYNYFAQIFDRFQAPPTATPMPAPIVLTPTTIPATPTGLPTNTPTPFTGSIRLLERDPLFDAEYVPVIAYAVPNSRVDKSWSEFYEIQTQNSDFVRIYASDNAQTYDPILALTDASQWAEGVCMASATMVGVQFWGDENDGWARVLVDGVERWRGNTYGRYPDLFVHFLEIRDLANAPHVIRIEPLGQVGTTAAGGNDDISIYAVVCGLPVETEIFLPILQR